MARQRKRKKRRNRLRRFVLHSMLCLFMVFALGFGVTIFFKIETITVEGNDHYSKEEIISASKIQLGSNLFRVSREDLSSTMTYTLPYIQTISLKISFPSEIRLLVEEQSGIVKLVTSEGSWYMGIQGKLLEKANTDLPNFSQYEIEEETGYWNEEGEWVEAIPESEWGGDSSSDVILEPLSTLVSLSDIDLPSVSDVIPSFDFSPEEYNLDLNEETSVITVTGIELIEPCAGQMIQVADEDSRQLNALLSLFQEMQSKQVLEDVSEIHVHVFQYFEFRYKDRFLVKFPFTGDFSYKLRALIAAVSDMESYETGTMDLTQEHYAVLFTPD